MFGIDFRRYIAYNSYIDEIHPKYQIRKILRGSIMKKSVAVLILLVLLIPMMAQPILAAGNSISVSPGSAELAVGESVTLNVSMQSSEACDIFGVILKYDTSVFEVTGGACTAAYSQGGESMINFANFSQSVGHEGFAVSCKEAVVYSGDLGYVTLQVKDGAAVGEQTISFATSAKNGASSVSVSAPTVTITIKGSTTVDPTTEAPTEATTEPTAPTEHEHTYASRWYYDKDNHWHECTTCGEKKDVKSHTPGPEATETEHQRCTVCNYVIKAAASHEHEYSTEWSYNVNRHWHECECGEKADVAAHTWSSVCSICGAKAPAPVQPDPVLPTTPTKPVAAPTEPEPIPVQEQSADAKWLVGGLILLGVVALAGLLYFVLFKSKR